MGFMRNQTLAGLKSGVNIHFRFIGVFLYRYLARANTLLPLLSLISISEFYEILKDIYSMHYTMAF